MLPTNYTPLYVTCLLNCVYITDGRSYYSGGYITRHHGSKNGGNVDAIQLEIPRRYRFEDDLRQTYAEVLGSVITEFFALNYNC